MTSNWIIDRSDLILVTAANCFVGFKVFETLIEYGFSRIRCFIRSDRNLSELHRVADSSQAAVDFVYGNLLSPIDCRNAVSDVSLILHLAAGTGKSFASCFMDSAVATRNLLEAATQESKLKRIVSVSSLAVYSGFSLRRGAVVDENCAVENEHMERFDPYCYGKVKQEELVIKYGKTHGLPYTIVRPGPVYGPGKKAITGRALIDSFGIHLHVGGSNRIPLIYIDNCAEAIVLAGLVVGLSGEIFNAVDDDLPTSRQFLQRYRKSGNRIFTVHLPYQLFYLFCWMWEKYSKWSQGQLPPVFNRRQCTSYYRKQIYSNRKLKKLTGWKPRVPFEEASRRYFEFMRNGTISK